MTAAGAPSTVLVYSNPAVRAQVRTAVGRRPAPDIGASTGSSAPPAPRSSRGSTRAASTWRSSTARRSRPAGWALARQFKYEIDDCPPIVRPDRPPAGRLAGQLVARRRRHPPPLDPVDAPRWSPSSCCAPRPAASPSSGEPRRDRRAELARRLLTTLLRGEPLEAADDTAWAMDEIMAGDGDAGPAGRVRGAAAGQGRDAGRARRAGRARCCAAGGAAAGRRPARSTSSAPAATGRNTVNISTMAALVVGRRRRAGRQARQPGRDAPPAARPTCWRSSAWRSTCPGRGVAAAVDEVGIGFCFAPVFHPGMRHARCRARRDSACRPSFNFLGPLTNPARAGRTRPSAAPTCGWRR